MSGSISQVEDCDTISMPTIRLVMTDQFANANMQTNVNMIIARVHCSNEPKVDVP